MSELRIIKQLITEDETACLNHKIKNLYIPNLLLIKVNKRGIVLKTIDEASSLSVIRQTDILLEDV